MPSYGQFSPAPTPPPSSGARAANTDAQWNKVTKVIDELSKRVDALEAENTLLSARATEAEKLPKQLSAIQTDLDEVRSRLDQFQKDFDDREVKTSALVDEARRNSKAIKDLNAQLDKQAHVVAQANISVRNLAARVEDVIQPRVETLNSLVDRQQLATSELVTKVAKIEETFERRIKNMNDENLAHRKKLEDEDQTHRKRLEDNICERLETSIQDKMVLHRASAVTRTLDTQAAQPSPEESTLFVDDEEPVTANNKRRASGPVDQPTHAAKRSWTATVENIRPAAPNQAGSSGHGPAKDQPVANTTPHDDPTIPPPGATPDNGLVKPEPQVPQTTRPAREPTPDGLCKSARDRFKFVRELKAFDYTDFTKYGPLREEILSTALRFPFSKKEIKNEICEFFLHTGEYDIVEPCPRSEVLGAPKEHKQSHEERDVVKRLGVIEGYQTGARGRSLHKGAQKMYLLCVGQVYKRVVNHKTDKTESTGWFLFIDVAKKDKPVYLIWREKTYQDGTLKATATWQAKTFGLEPGGRPDFFQVFHRVSDWPDDPDHLIIQEDRLKKVFDQNGRELHLTFTRPLYGYMVERIAEGWGKAIVSDVQPRSLPDRPANRTTNKAASKTVTGNAQLPPSAPLAMRSMASRAMTKKDDRAEGGPRKTSSGNVHPAARRPLPAPRMRHDTGL
ncbi:hypothetical protein GE09DRAFT_1157848 [Coniochaeta sp. 2T2.1]|nr:hypothetical protein GE09DRAFT_1157848 [Coniochaeta sp. 2T2.1]